MSKTKKHETQEADVLTAGEVARWLRIPKSTLYKLCQQGEIPAMKIGRHWRFQKSVLEGWLTDRMNRAAGPVEAHQRAPHPGKGR
ncbi:MAG: helix-turn-helix domain-containing protein [Planctomycetes bacterium]|nr:helix-turn-helix domain-containing protein [Planctomycetota bacterium]